MPTTKSIALLTLLLVLMAAWDGSSASTGLTPAELSKLRKEADEAHEAMLQAISKATFGASPSGTVPHPGVLTLQKNPAQGTPRPSTRSRERLLQGCNGPCLRNHVVSGLNNGDMNGFTFDNGVGSPGMDGYTMKSNAGSSVPMSRIYWDRNLFNTAFDPVTRIAVWFRGAPEAGKNSSAYLMEPGGRSSEGFQDGSKDEIDIAVVFGSLRESQWGVWKAGSQTRSGIHAAPDPGNKDYVYEMHLVRGKYLKLWVTTPPPNATSTGRTLSSVELWNETVPSNPLRLYIGIADCAGSPKCTGSFRGDAFLQLKSVGISNCA